METILAKFAIYYRKTHASAAADSFTVIAPSLAEARNSATRAVLTKYPNGVILHVVALQDSRFPVKRRGEWMSPGMLASQMQAEWDATIDSSQTK